MEFSAGCKGGDIFNACDVRYVPGGDVSPVDPEFDSHFLKKQPDARNLGDQNELIGYGRRLYPWW